MSARTCCGRTHGAAGKLVFAELETQRQLFSACMLRKSTVKIRARCRVWVQGYRNGPMLAGIHVPSTATKGRTENLLPFLRRSPTMRSQRSVGVTNWFGPHSPQGSPRLHRMCTELPGSALARSEGRVQSGIRACDESVLGSLPGLRWHGLEVSRRRPAGQPLRVPSEAKGSGAGGRCANPQAVRALRAVEF